MLRSRLVSLRYCVGRFVGCPDVVGPCDLDLLIADVLRVLCLASRRGAARLLTVAETGVVWGPGVCSGVPVLDLLVLACWLVCGGHEWQSNRCLVFYTVIFAAVPRRKSYRPELLSSGLGASTCRWPLGSWRDGRKSLTVAIFACVAQT